MLHGPKLLFLPWRFYYVNKSLDSTGLSPGSPPTFNGHQWIKNHFTFLQCAICSFFFLSFLSLEIFDLIGWNILKHSVLCFEHEFCLLSSHLQNDINSSWKPLFSISLFYYLKGIAGLNRLALGLVDPTPGTAANLFLVIAISSGFNIW